MRVNDDGSISTFRDMYGHDSRMIAALNGKTYFSDAVAEDNSAAAPWKPPGRGPVERPGPAQRQAFAPRVGQLDDFTRSLFGF